MFTNKSFAKIINIKKNLPIILIAIYFIFYSVISLFYIHQNYPIAPDDSQSLFFSKVLSEQKTLNFINPLNVEFQQKVFTPRQYVQKGNSTLPGSFIGYIIFLAIFRAINYKLIFIVGPIFASFTLFYIYKLVKYIFSEKVALLTIFIVGVLPPFLYWSVSFYDNIPDLAFIFATIYYLFKGINEGKQSDYILTGLFFSLAVWTRYLNVVTLPLFLFPYLFLVRKKIDFKKLIIAAIIVIFSICTLFLTNLILFNSIINPGQSSPYLLKSVQNFTNVPNQINDFLPFRSIGLFLKNSKIYLYSFNALLFVLSLIGIFKALRSKTVYLRKEVIALSILCVCWIIYYIGGVYQGYGIDIPFINSSYERYLLLVYICMTIYVVYLLVTLNISKYLKIISFIFFFTIMLLQSFTYPGGLQSLKNQVNYYSNFMLQLKEFTSDDSIIFTKGADKFIYPERNIVVYSYLELNSETTDEKVDKTLSLIKQLITTGHHVYFLNEDSVGFRSGVGLSSMEYINRLKKYSLYSDQYNKDLNLYSINKL